jgi:hypothetical protein
VTILVDTNIVIEFLRGNSTAVAWFDGLDERVAISAISLLELYAGARSQRDEQDIIAVRQRLDCLLINQDIGERAGAIMRHYRKSHGIDIPDALIAATAEHHGLRLATLNVKHFPMFPRLKRAY